MISMYRVPPLTKLTQAIQQKKVASVLSANQKNWDMWSQDKTSNCHMLVCDFW